MENWDKLYIHLKDLLAFKNSTARALWSLASSLQANDRITVLNIWKTETMHTLILNKLLQNLGYTQIKPISKPLHLRTADIFLGLDQLIAQKQDWLTTLEKISNENFGNDIYFSLVQITAEDLVNIEILKELQKVSEEY